MEVSCIYSYTSPYQRHQFLKLEPDWWHNLLSYNKQGIGLGGVQNICHIGCKLQPDQWVDGYVAVCLVLTSEVYALTKYLSILWWNLRKA